jgi:hypothetical protein
MVPGRFILFAAQRMLPPRHTTLLVQPAIADLQHEWARARTTSLPKRIHAAACGYCAVGRTCAWAAAASLLSGVVAPVSYRAAREVTFPCVVGAAIPLGMKSLLSDPRVSFAPVFWDTVMMAFTIVPLVLAGILSLKGIAARDHLRVTIGLWVTAWVAMNAFAPAEMLTATRRTTDVATFMTIVPLCACFHVLARRAQEPISLPMLVTGVAVLFGMSWAGAVAVHLQLTGVAEVVTLAAGPFLVSVAALVATTLTAPKSSHEQGL